MTTFLTLHFQNFTRHWFLPVNFNSIAEFLFLFSTSSFVIILSFSFLKITSFDFFIFFCSQTRMLEPRWMPMLYCLHWMTSRSVLSLIYWCVFKRDLWKTSEPNILRSTASSTYYKRELEERSLVSPPRYVAVYDYRYLTGRHSFMSLIAIG